MAVIQSKIIDLLNYRIRQEEQSSRIYKGMSIWLDFNGYSGAAKLWGKYSDEELKHAEWTYKYLLDLNIKPEVQPIEFSKTDFTGLPQIIAISYQHELDISHQCNTLASEVVKVNDFMTLGLAQQYLKEQVEELAKIQKWVDRLNSFGNDLIALRMLDEEMGES